jgi:hypothetical protein
MLALMSWLSHSACSPDGLAFYGPVINMTPAVHDMAGHTLAGKG